MIKSILVVLLLLLGGCGGEGVAAFLGSAGSLGGAYLIDTTQTDARDVAAFNAKHNMRVDRVVQRCFNEASKMEDWASAKPVYMECFKFEEENQPAIFIERLRNRIKRAKENKK